MAGVKRCVFHCGRCEVRPDYCELSACSNGATCINREGGFSCLCPPGYGGDLCTDVTDPCGASPCRNGGRCVREGAGLVSCSCPALFGGPDCSLPRDPCAANPCRSNGLCSPTDFTPRGFLCRCFDGFAGAQCDVSTSSICSTQPCSNKGQCVPVGGQLSAMAGLYWGPPFHPASAGLHLGVPNLHLET